MSAQRITVLQLVDGFATEEASGGAAQFGIQLARYLDQRIYRSVVCGLWRYNTPSERRWRTLLHAEGIDTTIFAEREQPVGNAMVRATLLLRERVQRDRPAIINSHFERGDLLGLAMRVTSTRAPRIVRTMHADQQWQTRPWLGAVLNIVAFPWLFDGEVAISQATRAVMDQRIAARLRRRKATVLYNGISSTLLHLPAPRPSPAPPRIIIVGRLEEQKGHRYLFQALPQVLKAFPELEVLVVGTGSLAATLQTLAQRLGIAPAVHLLGQRSDVRALLAEAHVFVSASIWEGFPTAILEAMAATVPVVATDVSGSRELVRDGETGLLVPMRQPAALAQAICTMLAHPQAAASMAAQARAQVAQHTLEITARGYAALYHQILRQPDDHTLKESTP